MGDTSEGKSVEFYAKVLNNPETHFDLIIQKARQYLAEVQSAIYRLKNNEPDEIDLIETGNQIEKTLAEVTRIVSQLQEYVEETTIRRSGDSAVSPRVLSAVKSKETSLNDLSRSLRNTKRDLQVARTERERRDLLNQWRPFDRSPRTPRDAEEIMSDSTERLMNSKRILLETIQSSSGTLGSLATSSQYIQSNEEELHTQSHLVTSARSLLQKYGRRASTDKLLIWLGFIFFLFCALIVAYRRIL